MQYWAKIYSAMETVGMSEDEIKSICAVLAAIYHLGVAGASKGDFGLWLVFLDVILEIVVK